MQEFAIRIASSPSEIDGSEDMMGRMEYMRLLTANPQTGRIPDNIRQRELEFDKRLIEQSKGARIQQIDVESSGPFNVGGRTRAVAFDIRDESTIIAGGVSGSIWKSTDGGTNWIKKSNPENRNSVTCIVQDTRPGKENIWYHGTGEIFGNSTSGGDAPFRGNGIYKSTDNGENWTALPSTQDSGPHLFNSQFQYIWNIEINPLNLVEDEVLVAAYGGILRSVDGGISWEVELGQQLFNLDDSVDLNESNASFFTSLERSSSNVFYATLSTASSLNQVSSDAGIYYSLNGKDWQDITPFTNASRYRRIVIGTSESNPDITYFFTDPESILVHDLSAISPISKGFVPPFERELPEAEVDIGGLNTQDSYNMMIRVHPKDHENVLVGGTNLFRSTDGFKTAENIQWIGGYNPEGDNSVYPDHHPDQHDLLFLPSNSNVALSATDGGLFLTDNILADSVLWRSISKGYVTTQFFTIAQSKVVGDATILGGMQDNGTDISPAGNANWKGIMGGDGSYAATTKDNALWFASFQKGQVLRLTLNDDYELTSFGRVDPEVLVKNEGSQYLFINPFVLDPTNPNRMFVAGGNHLYFNPNVSQIPGGSQESSDLGWSKVNPNPVRIGLISTVEIAYTGEKLYFGTNGGELYRVDQADDQLNFDVVTLSSSIFPVKGYISCVAVDPEDSDHLLVIFSNYQVPSIFESKDGGDTFVNVSGNLEENPDGSGNGPSIRWAEIIPTLAGKRYVVGTSTGLYATDELNASTQWNKQSISTLGSAVIPMMDYRPEDGRLVIATHGNGVWETKIEDYKEVGLLEKDDPFRLIRAYPNPFFTTTQIQYSIPDDGVVKIDILNAGGGHVRTLLWAQQYEGMNTVTWDGKNAGGVDMPNGVYFYAVRYSDQRRTGRLLLSR